MKIGVEKFGITKHGGFVTKEHNLRVVYAETQLVMYVPVPCGRNTIVAIC